MPAADFNHVSSGFTSLNKVRWYNKFVCAIYIEKPSICAIYQAGRPGGADGFLC
jgi:hypothetical protein